MKNHKKNLDELIDEFLDVWDRQQMVDFFRDVIPIIELYDVDEENDWLKDAVGEKDLKNVRLLRTVYLLSKLCDFHVAKMLTITLKFKGLWRKMEFEANET